MAARVGGAAHRQLFLAPEADDTEGTPAGAVGQESRTFEDPGHAGAVVVGADGMGLGVMMGADEEQVRRRIRPR